MVGLPKNTKDVAQSFSNRQTSGGERYLLTTLLGPGLKKMVDMVFIILGLPKKKTIQKGRSAIDLGVMGQWGRRNMGVACGNMTFFD